MGLKQIAPFVQSKTNRFNLMAFNQKTGWLFPVTLAHFLLTCLFTFPLILNFNRALPGLLLEDRDQNLWNLWWVPRALLNLKNPFRTDYMYYPENVSLYFHTLHPLNGIISYPVQILFGLTVAYNFIVFFSFIVAGLGSFALLDYLCQNKAAAFTASLIFSYAPYHIGTLKGIMQLISLEWLPLYILFLLKANRPADQTRRQQTLNLILAILFLICNALIDWYYTLFLLMFTFLYLIYPHEKPYLAGFKTRLLRISLILGGFALLMSPILLPMFKELTQTSYYLPSQNAALGFSATLAAFFVPPTTSTFLGGLAANFPAQYLTGPLAAQVYLGYVALFLAIVGIVLVRAARFWGFIALIFWLLAFGPALQLNDAQPGFPMPFALIQNWPIIKITRSPDRFSVITMLALAVCAAFALSSSFFTKSAIARRPLLAIYPLACLLIMIEFLQIPYPINAVSYSPFFEQLRQDKADYSIIELPAQGGFWSGAPRMANQTIHQKRIFNGYVSREYDHPFTRSTPGFQELILLKENSDIFEPALAPNLPANINSYSAFAYYKARYIVLYYPQTQKERDSIDLAKNRQMIARIIPNPKPIYQDEKLEAYALPQLPENQLKPFAQIGEGWYEAEQSAGGGRHRWSAGYASLNLLWQGPNERSTDLAFNLALLFGEQSLRITLDGTTIWQNQITDAEQNLEVHLKLKPGQHKLEFFPAGQPQTPKALGLSPTDTRKLLFYLGNLSIR